MPRRRVTAPLMKAIALLAASAGQASARGGEPTLAPLAFVRFCMENPADCRAGRDQRTKPLVWSEDLSQRLALVNAAVNAQIIPQVRAPGSGPERWSIAPTRGDCNDYAVTKRHRLLAQGYPPGALLLAVVTTARNEGHLVLVVRTTRGDLVLDNLDTAVRPFPETGHHLVSRQTPADPRVWAS
ncbi:transglutaminase-like cysteine peptidase [Salinarimonas soli]|uniref:Transglutaminase-like cysteine peptidase n=1 Tax=Salinarimonas soli TaxID=1638099 RepID=A0A5B2VV99_9HYPH|nr:transglutaminase-like cysteine peptidase [Salinarimonas soli]KAA2242242.1 transglutaminase-like cysteine peptidase [Salinarimonas soli]